VDPLGLEPPRDIPPGVDMCVNGGIAKKFKWYKPNAFFNMVRTGGDWDYKQIDSKYQDFGNYNFGYVAVAYELPREYIRYIVVHQVGNFIKVILTVQETSIGLMKAIMTILIIGNVNHIVMVSSENYL